MKLRRSSSLFLIYRLQRQCLVWTCVCLVLLLLLYSHFLKENSVVQFGTNGAPTPSVRIHVSHVWVVKDNSYFTNEEYNDLLASSLRSQHFEPSLRESAVSEERSPWEELVEGRDDYFTSPDNDSENSHRSERFSTCKMPVRNILFLKTHFTGSDVITNVLNRFGDLRELFVALPSDGLSSFYWPSKFHWRYMDMKRLHGNLPNILCNHARYDAEVLENFMPFNTRYVTILRNPVDYFMTVFEELEISERMGIHSSNPFETFVLNAKGYIKKVIKQKRFSSLMNLLKNGMFFDLGLHTSEYDQEIAISSAIFDLQKRFSLVLIHEYLDESLVLMKRKFCWDIDDVIYLSSVLPRMPSTNVVISSRTRRAIAAWNKADWMLYEIFNATFWETIRHEKDFNSEVALFKTRRRELEAYCSGKSAKKPEKLNLVNLNFNDSLGTQTEPEEICRKMAMSVTEYLGYFREKIPTENA